MKEKQIQEKYGIGLRMGLLLQLQVVLVALALILTCRGIMRSFDATSRLIVYIGQAVACVSVIVFAGYHFRFKNPAHFKIVIYAYALLEGLRGILLSTNGIPGWAAFGARALLMVLACSCVLFAERLGRKDAAYISCAIILFEIALYGVFWFGFPAVRANVLYAVLPLAGVLIAVSLGLFNMACMEQARNS